MMKEIETKIKQIIAHSYSLILLGLIPCFLIIFFQIHKASTFHRLSEEALYLKEKKQWTEKKANLEQALLHQMETASRDYLENEIESLQFLLPEMQKLKALIHADPSLGKEKARLDYLQNGQNALRFRQQNFQRLGKFQEMEAIQLHPVEMNREDLKELLGRIENLPIGHSTQRNPPDLLIKQFELFKKPLPSNEEIFLVHLELIKREVIHE